MISIKVLTRSTLLVTVLASLMLSGCASSSAEQARLHFASARYLNPDVNGNPAPVVVNVYELKAPYAFKQAKYTQLSSNAAAVLGTNLIDKQSFEIRPGSERNVTINLTSNTRYLGIAAAYRNIDQANWRNVIAIPKKHKKVSLAISLQSQGIITKKQG